MIERRLVASALLVAFLTLLSACSATEVQHDQERPDGPPSDPPTAEVGTSLERPTLHDPTHLRVEADPGSGLLELDPDRDYVIEMPDRPVSTGLVIQGGRNVVLIGGEIAIPWQGQGASISSRTGLKIRDATGTVHVEGLRIGGDDVSEGIQIDAPEAKVQLQRVGVYGIHARDQDDFTDNHPDLIQTYGGVAALHVDGFTGSTDYQGFLFKVDTGDGPHGPVTLRHVDIVGGPTARHLLWWGTESGFGDVTLDDVWLDVPEERDASLHRAVWPSAHGAYPQRARIHERDDGVQYATWPDAMEPEVRGRVYEGRPPGGAFVPPDSIGIGYEAR